jgi:hypothetical protein
MKFVHPEMLWGLTALAVPILVHLFNFRKFKKVMFSNVNFLKEIKLETQSKSKLKHLLILLTRMLALTAIVFAFAQPYLPQPGMTAKPGGNAVSIYIDNSFSMQGAGRDGRLLELAKNKALEIVEAFAISDKFQLLTSDFEGRHQRLVSKEEMTDLIQEVDISPVTRTMSEVASRQRDALLTSGLDNKRSFLLTDLQLTVTNPEAITNDTSIRFTVVPEIPEVQRNVFIDSVWFETPVRQLNQPEILHARIVNTGNESMESLPIQLMINGTQKSVATAIVPALGKTETSITYTNTESGFKQCSLVLDDASITKDDAFYFSYAIAPQIHVLEVKGTDVSEGAVQAVFGDDPFYAFSSMNEGTIDFSQFGKQEFIVLNQLRNVSSGLSAELDKFIKAGGSILIIPGKEIILNDYDALLTSWNLGHLQGKQSAENRVSDVNYEHYIFKEAFRKSDGNVDLPQSMAHYVLNISAGSTAEPMMRFQDGSPFMVSGKVELGRVYFVSVSLNTDESNFIRHAFFPAALIRMAEYSQPTQPLAYTLGADETITLRNATAQGDQTYHLRNIVTQSEIIPEHRFVAGQVELFVHDMQDAGNYALEWGADPVSPLAFNYNRAESYNAVMSVDDFSAKLSELNLANWSVLSGDTEAVAAEATQLEEGTKYWLTLIIWALTFLAIEVLLIKFWR